jgi:peptide/nickel transport system permease protein
MRSYLIRRVLLAIPTLIIVSIIVFLTIRLIPGSVVDMMVRDNEGFGDLAEARAKVEQKLGLDHPLYSQYFTWVGNIIIHGDFGYSLWKGYPVLPEILHRVPVSIELGVLAMIISLCIAFPIGIYSAIRQDTVGDYIARSVSIACIAIPAFWLGTVIIVFPSIWWGWSPPVEYVNFIDNPLQNLKIMIIPAIIMGMNMSGIVMRMTRTMMLEVLRQDYTRTAWAKGLTERTVILRHALKNAAIPVVSIIGLQVPVFIGGSIVLEQLFALPGVGRLTIEVLNNRDYAVLSGINLFVVVFVLVTNLLVDVSYKYLDPRIKYS